MPMITRAGVDATDALKISSEVNLMLEMKEKSQKKSHLHRWASIAWISVDHVHSKWWNAGKNATHALTHISMMTLKHEQLEQ